MAYLHLFDLVRLIIKLLFLLDPKTGSVSLACSNKCPFFKKKHLSLSLSLFATVAVYDPSDFRIVENG